MEKPELIVEWIKYSQTDLNVAKQLFENMRPHPLEIICYHAQQSVEKTLLSIAEIKLTTALKWYVSLFCAYVLFASNSFFNMLNVFSTISLFPYMLKTSLPVKSRLLRIIKSLHYSSSFVLPQG